VILLIAASVMLVFTSLARADDLEVLTTSPARNTLAPVVTPITIDFDRPVSTASVTSSSFRVFGKRIGPVPGHFIFTNGNQSVTFNPSRVLSAGETVLVNLSHDIVAEDLSPLRKAGYAFQFSTMTMPTSMQFVQIDSMSNRIGGAQTRIYGAAATDFNEDGYIDLATINEVSADVRVTLNRADGSGLFGTFLPPQSISEEASPSESADFNHDGHVDLCVAPASGDSIWVLLGNGDGVFGSVQSFKAGSSPHGIATLDADGDGDMDIVSANLGDSNLALLINDGSGSFGAPMFFEGGVLGEDGLAAADMNSDGISDVVVAGRFIGDIAVHLGNGDSTFTLAGPAQETGGNSRVVALGDVDGDGNIDATTANDQAGNAALLLGMGDGTLAAPLLTPIPGRATSTDLGDLDGDGDMDWVLSSFTGFWRLYRNDGGGTFVLQEEFPAPANASCAVLLDFDNDGDVDMVLTDEIADVVLVMENLGGPTGVEVGTPGRSLTLA
jgi:hypothetical protein